MEEDRKISILPESAPDDTRQMFNTMQSQAPPLPTQAPPPPPSQAPPPPSQAPHQICPHYQAHGSCSISPCQHLHHFPSPIHDQLTRPPPPLSVKQPTQNFTTCIQMPYTTNTPQTMAPFPPRENCENCTLLKSKTREAEEARKVVADRNSNLKQDISELKTTINHLQKKLNQFLNTPSQQNQQRSNISLNTQISGNNVYETPTVTSMQAQNINFSNQSNVLTNQQSHKIENPEHRILMSSQNQSFLPSPRQTSGNTNFTQISGHTYDQNWPISDQVSKRLTQKLESSTEPQIMRNQQITSSALQQRPQQILSYGTDLQNQCVQYSTMMVPDQQQQQQLARPTVNINKNEQHQTLHANVNTQYMANTTNQIMSNNQDVFTSPRQTLSSNQQGMTFGMNQQLIPVSSNAQMMPTNYADQTMRVSMNPTDPNDVRYVTTKYYTEGN